jgi:ADP-ribosylation factor GTPase-activating protein 1
MCYLQIAALAQGREWNEATSSAQNYVSSSMNRYDSSPGLGGAGYSNSDQQYNCNSDSSSYQSGGGYQSLDAQPNLRDQKEAFFARRQNENALKPE